MAALAPDSCITLDSLSKKVAPGPGARLHRFAAAPARAHHGRGPVGRMDGVRICLCRRATADGRRHGGRTVTAETDRRGAAPADGGRDTSPASRSRRTPNPTISGSRCRQHWRSQTFVAAAARRDIALTPSTTFAVTPGHAPNAVRLALGAPSDRTTRSGAAHAFGNADGEGRFRYDRIELPIARLAHRPLRDKAPRLVRLDLVPFMSMRRGIRRRCARAPAASQNCRP